MDVSVDLYKDDTISFYMDDKGGLDFDEEGYEVVTGIITCFDDAIEVGSLRGYIIHNT